MSVQPSTVEEGPVRYNVSELCCEPVYLTEDQRFLPPVTRNGRSLCFPSHTSNGQALDGWVLDIVAGSEIDAHLLGVNPGVCPELHHPDRCCCESPASELVSAIRPSIGHSFRCRSWLLRDIELDRGPATGKGSSGAAGAVGAARMAASVRASANIWLPCMGNHGCGILLLSIAERLGPWRSLSAMNSGRHDADW
ncbi:hypothetical protein VTK26DRAFT_8784 [Humicola hyalothermophila]